jgi:hypothetical protein
MKNKQTAVEWFIEQIESGKIEIVYSNKIHSIKCIPEIIEQAKEMEKQQIIEAYDRGEFNCGVNESAEEYYNKTFKK